MKCFLHRVDASFCVNLLWDSDWLPFGDIFGGPLHSDACLSKNSKSKERFVMASRTHDFPCPLHLLICSLAHLLTFATPRHALNVGRLSDDGGGDFVSQRPHGVFRRTNKGDIISAQNFGEFGEFGSVTPSSPNRLHRGALGDVQNQLGRGLQPRKQ